MWVQKIEEFLSERQREEEDTILAKEMSSLLKEERLQEEKVVDISECPPITHGGVIVDRKSTFQAHLALVTSLHQVKLVGTLLCHRMAWIPFLMPPYYH